ncbi:MAG: DUF3078 domain-containing protein [Bacteroidota bacterium]
MIRNRGVQGQSGISPRPGGEARIAMRWLGLWIVLCLLPTVSIEAQTLLEEPERIDSDSLNSRGVWDMRWSAGLRGSQAAYSNWSRGGVSTMSLSSNSLIQLLYERNSFNYEFRVRSRYGQARIQGEGVRKTDDEIAVRNRFLWDIGGGENDFRYFGDLNLETQYTKSFDYGGGENGTDLLISDFFSPGYLTQNTGVAWFPADRSYSIEGGLGLKQTIVADTTLSTRYGLDPGSNIKVEAGVTLGFRYEQEVMQDIVYKAELETFTNLYRAVRRTDLFLKQELVGKVNEHVDVGFRFELIYDDDFSRRIQLSQALSAGITVRLQ